MTLLRRISLQIQRDTHTTSDSQEVVFQTTKKDKFKTDVETLRPVLLCAISVLAKLNSSNLH